MHVIRPVPHGSKGTANEGWFDPYALTTTMRQRALDHGAHYLTGTVIGLPSTTTGGSGVSDDEPTPDSTSRNRTITGVVVDVKDGHSRADSIHGGAGEGGSTGDRSNNQCITVTCGSVINAAGCWSSQLLALALASDDPTHTPPPATTSTPENTSPSVPAAPTSNATAVAAALAVLPVVPRKRNVFVLQCPHILDPPMPLLVDPAGYWIRRDGPPEASEPCTRSTVHNTSCAISERPC